MDGFASILTPFSGYEPPSGAYRGTNETGGLVSVKFVQKGAPAEAEGAVLMLGAHTYIHWEVKCVV